MDAYENLPKSLEAQSAGEAVMPRRKVGVVKLLRYTTWKCGRLERAIIRFLYERGFVARLEEIRDYLRNEHWTAGLRRLSRRRIIQVVEAKR